MDIAERNALVLQYLPLCWKLASRARHDPRLRKNMELQDVVQEACLYLIEAVERFDPTRCSPRTGAPTKLITFAYKWVKLKLRTLAKNCNLIRVPVHVGDHLYDDAETKWRQRVADARRALGYQQPEVDRFGAEIEPACYEVDVREAADIRRDIAEALVHLSPRDREVLERRYGLLGAPEALAEVAADWGCSRERVRQVQERALVKARRWIPVTLGEL